MIHDLVTKRPLFERAVAADNKYALAMAVMRDAPDFDGASAAVVEWSALGSRCLTKNSGLRLQLVDWPDFSPKNGSARERLKRAISVSAASSDRELYDGTRAQTLHRTRLSFVQQIVEDMRKQLLAEISPGVRITELVRQDGRVGLYLAFAGMDLGVQLAIECAWESGVRENVGALRLAAQAAMDPALIVFSGERRPIGEIDVETHQNVPLLEPLIEAASEILVRHHGLLTTGGVAAGDDLVALTWAK